MDALPAHEAPDSLSANRVLPAAQPDVSLSAQRSRSVDRRLAGHFVLAAAAGHDGDFAQVFAAHRDRAVSDRAGLFGPNVVPKRSGGVYSRHSVRLLLAAGVLFGGHSAGWDFYPLPAIDSFCRFGAAR